MLHEIGDRLKIGQDFCTVRYVGILPKWPSSITYGVEWDNPNRGKNCGKYKGQEYFKTGSEFGGSFIKESTLIKKAESGVTFCKALEDKYLTSSLKDDNICLGTKKMETVGIDKINERNKNLKSFTQISLDGRLVNDILNTAEELNFIKKSFSNLNHLDLSYNLLSDFANLCYLFEQFTNLQSVDISGNRFTKTIPMCIRHRFEQVKFLSLLECGLDNNQLRSILMVFPIVTQLNISKNALLNVNDEGFEIPETVRFLDISFNALKTIPRKLYDCHIETLNFSNNEIDELLPGTSSYLRNIDLSNNFISSWEVLDQLNENFPELYSLRLNQNPLFLKDDTDSFYQIIARFNKVEIVNGSILAKGLRYEAEMYFVSKLRDGEISLNKNLKRWQYLSNIYKIALSPLSSQKIGLDAIVIKLNMICQEIEQTEEMVLLSSYSVRYLKHLCCNKFNLNLFRIKLYHSVSPGIRDELNREFYTLRHFNISDGDTIYLETK